MKFSKKAMFEYGNDKKLLLSCIDDILTDLDNAKKGVQFQAFLLPEMAEGENYNRQLKRYVADIWHIKVKDLNKLIAIKKKAKKDDTTILREVFAKIDDIIRLRENK